MTAAGGPRRTSTLKLTLTAARISGRRDYHGEIVAAEAWPAIITADESDQLRALLTRPERRTNSTARRYLLSSILRCARCGLGMVGRSHGGTPRYICANAPGSRHCGTIMINAERADQEIRDQILAALSSAKFAGQRMRAASEGHPGAADITAKLRAAEERRD